MMKVAPSKDPRKSEPGARGADDGAASELPALPSEKALIDRSPAEELVERVFTVGFLGVMAGGMALYPLVGLLDLLTGWLALAFAGHVFHPASLLLPVGSAALALLMVLLTFLGWEALRYADPRRTLLDLEKQGDDEELPPALNRALEVVFTAGVGPLFAIPLLVVLEILGVGIGTMAPVALGFLASTAFFGYASAAGWMDTPEEDSILPGAVLRIGQVLRVRKVRCPYCATRVRGEDRAVACEACETIHHRECWMETEGCTTYGCGGHSAREVGPEAGAEPEAPPEEGA